MLCQSEQMLSKMPLYFFTLSDKIEQFETLKSCIEMKQFIACNILHQYGNKIKQPTQINF